ncbi:PHP domain-containing protein [Succinivibrio dextrinosolvens]|uniref:PHP domain-containing protein n=1 Tax=Succinivibrio dextrinosolvens TaxID=83771 RepID=UPI00241FD765|nr:PHP domain-containing protein [Succinivibrio dextrinosolvens]
MAAVFSKIDLHSHSNASDGALSPSELVERALNKGLTHLALTDHDTVLGVKEAQDAATGKLELIPGAELSTMWNGYQIHIVGLFIDTKSEVLLKYLEGQKVFREERARAIGAKLERQGFANAYEECRKRAADGASITRGNYARYIVEMGRAQDSNEAFNYYLKKGKSCYVKTMWPDISVACNAIIGSGGIAVLAHPRRYEMTNTKLRELMSYFKDCGGQAMEVGCSQMSLNDLNYMATLCRKYDFMASLGSDFHNEGPFRELGLGLRIPDDLKKVWECPRAERYNFPALKTVTEA